MDITSLFRQDLRELNPYKAVDSPEALAEMAGIPPERIIKLNGNENPYGPSKRVQEALGRHDGYHIYPDARQNALRSALEEYTGAPSSHIIVGAGADELIDLLLRATLESRGGGYRLPANLRDVHLQHPGQRREAGLRPKGRPVQRRPGRGEGCH